MKKEMYFDYDAFSDDYREKIAEIRRDNPNILSKEIEDIIRNEVGLSHSVHRCIMRKD